MRTEKSRRHSKEAVVLDTIPMYERKYVAYEIYSYQGYNKRRTRADHPGFHGLRGRMRELFIMLVRGRIPMGHLSGLY